MSEKTKEEGVAAGQHLGLAPNKYFVLFCLALSNSIDRQDLDLEYDPL